MGISNPLISIIIPFRNRERYIQRSLASFRRIKYRPIELIFVDNASEDQSREFVEHFFHDIVGKDVATILLTEPTIGACKARNYGLHAAHGDFVYFFDDDDEISADFLDDALPYLHNNDIVAAPTLMIFPTGVAKVRYTSFSDRVRDQILTGMLSTQSMLIRKSALISAGEWNEKLPKWNDWELGVRLLKKGLKITWLKKAYHRIHQHPDSLTGPSLATTYSLLQPALLAVASLSLTDSEKRALAAKELIISRELEKAGEKQQSSAIKTRNLKLYPSLFLLCCYLRLIDRGAWRFYRTFWL